MRLLLPPLRVEATGPRPAPEVWRDYTTPARWPSWAPQIVGVQHAGERIAAGSDGVVHGPLGLRVPFAVRSVDDERQRWSWAPGLGPVRVQMRHGVDETEAGTCAWVEIMLPAVAAMPYSPLASAALRRLVGAA